jgi:hypothetical protein
MDEFVKATAPLLAANLLTVALIHSFLKYDRNRQSGLLAITVALGLATTYAAPCSPPIMSSNQSNRHDRRVHSHRRPFSRSSVRTD